MATADSPEDIEITKCSICLEDFNVPRLVPCFHTFCETCLGSYITTEIQQQGISTASNFNCPICRETIEPPDSKAAFQQWAGQFPLNHFIFLLCEQKKIEAKVKSCDPCKFHNNDVMAVYWCFDCNEALCEACYSAHTGSRLTRNHTLKAMNEMDAMPILTSVQPCEKHKDKNVEAFCNDHDQPCCTTCLTLHHRKCDHVACLEDAASRVIESLHFIDLSKRLSEVNNFSHELVKENRKTVQSLAKEKSDIQEELLDMRQRVIDHFDNLQSKFMQEFTRVHDQKVGELNALITEVTNRDKMIQNCKQLMESCKTRVGETRVFLEMKKILRQEREQMKIFANILENHKRLQYRFQKGADIDKLLGDLKSIGKVDIVEKTSTSSKLSSRNTSISLKECNPEMVTTFCVFKKCGVKSYIRGGCFMPDNTLLLPLYDDETIVRITQQGDLIKKSPVLSGCVWDLAVIDPNTVVVTRPDEKAIDFVNIETLTLNKTKSLDAHCYGIDFSDNRIYLGCSDKLLVLDRDGNLINEVNANGFIKSVTVINGKKKILVYINGSNMSCHFVRLGDFQEIIVFKYKDLGNLYGVTSDREGNVYFAESFSVSQLSSSEKRLRFLCVILTAPNTIKFDVNSNRFFVTYFQSGYVDIYDMVKRYPAF